MLSSGDEQPAYGAGGIRVHTQRQRAHAVSLCTRSIVVYTLTGQLLRRPLRRVKFSGSARQIYRDALPNLASRTAAKPGRRRIEFNNRNQSRHFRLQFGLFGAPMQY